MSLTKVSVSKSCFYNDCVSHPEADKTLTDGGFSFQYYYSRFDQPKNYPAKNKKNIYSAEKGSGQTTFGQKSGPALAGPAVPPTTALHITSIVSVNMLLKNYGLPFKFQIKMRA